MDGSSEVIEALDLWWAWFIGRVHARLKRTYLLNIEPIEESFSVQAMANCEVFISKMVSRLGRENVKWEFSAPLGTEVCIVDFIRPDARQAIVKAAGPDEAIAAIALLGWGSVYFEAKPEPMTVQISDVTVPSEKVEVKIRQLEDLGLKMYLEMHRYDMYGIVHIHFRGKVTDLDKFVEVLTS